MLNQLINWVEATEARLTAALTAWLARQGEALLAEARSAPEALDDLATALDRLLRSAEDWLYRPTSVR